MGVSLKKAPCSAPTSYGGFPVVFATWSPIYDRSKGVWMVVVEYAYHPLDVSYEIEMLDVTYGVPTSVQHYGPFYRELAVSTAIAIRDIWAETA